MRSILHKLLLRVAPFSDKGNIENIEDREDKTLSEKGVSSYQGLALQSFPGSIAARRPGRREGGDFSPPGGDARGMENARPGRCCCYDA